jgi:hypothetical protein
MRFCCQKHAMNWHNSRAPWQERKDRHKKNAERKAAYRADPEFWQNKARAWRENNPEGARLIAQRAKEKYWTSPWKRLVIAAKNRAEKRKLSYDLTFEWAENRWTGFCEISGIPFQPRYGASHGIFSPSIDRIEPSKGYTQDNARFVLMGVNGLKVDGTDAEMYFVAEAITRNKGLKSRSL